MSHTLYALYAQPEDPQALTSDDQAALDAALSGPEGAAAVADLDNVAGAGVTLLNGPTTVYP